MKKRTELQSRVNDCSQVIRDLFVLRNLIDEGGLESKTASVTILGLISIYNKKFSALNEEIKKIDNGHN